MRLLDSDQRNLFVYDDATVEELPITGEPYIPDVSADEPFTPKGSDKPTLYPGDVIVLVDDGRIVVAELIVKKLEDGVLVQPLDSVIPETIDDGYFNSRFYRVDEAHIYDNVAPERPELDVEFDESKLGEYETTGRSR